MTSSLSDPALSALLHGPGTTTADDRLRWMVLTWDLASVKPGDKSFSRVFLTEDSFLGVYGILSPDVFSSVDPTLGAVDETQFCTTEALGYALAHAEKDIKYGGMSPLCRPLAVDLSHFADPDVEEEEPWRDAGALLADMEAGTRRGFSVLAAINKARAAAIDTHLVEGWAWTFARTDRLDLWCGR